MPAVKARIDAPGAWHHIIIRRHKERKAIFKDSAGSLKILPSASSESYREDPEPAAMAVGADDQSRFIYSSLRPGYGPLGHGQCGGLLTGYAVTLLNIPLSAGPSASCA